MLILSVTESIACIVSLPSPIYTFEVSKPLGILACFKCTERNLIIDSP